MLEPEQALDLYPGPVVSHSFNSSVLRIYNALKLVFCFFPSQIKDEKTLGLVNL